MHNIDMLKLLKDEIAFRRGELSRELKSNQKTMEVLLEHNSHYQTHWIRCNEFRQFDPPNSFTREPPKSLLKSANTTKLPMIIGNKNIALEAPTGNVKVNTESIKAKEKVILVVDSISGINRKGLSTDKFTTVARDILGVTSEGMVHHTIPSVEKNPKN